MINNPHEKHREREKKEFLLRGFDENTPPHKVLELLLFYCVPRVDTNPLAHELIDRYKSISGVLDAPVEELITFKGLTLNNVGLLKMIMPIARIYQSENPLDENKQGTYEEVCSYIVGRYMGLTEEHFGVAYLDGCGRLIEFEFIAKGESNIVTVSNRLILEKVIRNKASSVIIAHNHHNSILLPSADDVLATERISAVLSSVDVRLIDHLIISHKEYVSMAQSQKYKYIFI